VDLPSNSEKLDHSDPVSIAEQLAQEKGVSSATVYRAAGFAAAVDRLAAAEPEVLTKILADEAPVIRRAIVKTRKLSNDEVAVAHKLGQRAIGLELNADFIQLAQVHLRRPMRAATRMPADEFFGSGVRSEGHLGACAAFISPWPSRGDFPPREDTRLMLVLTTAVSTASLARSSALALMSRAPACQTCLREPRNDPEPFSTFSYIFFALRA
jgi:hypothetical protein